MKVDGHSTIYIPTKRGLSNDEEKRLMQANCEHIEAQRSQSQEVARITQARNAEIADNTSAQSQSNKKSIEQARETAENVTLGRHIDTQA